MDDNTPLRDGNGGIYGPQTEQVEDLLTRCRSLTKADVGRLFDAYATTVHLAGTPWATARDSTGFGMPTNSHGIDWARVWTHVWGYQVGGYDLEAQGPALDAVWDAFLALFLRDAIEPDAYDELTRPWRQTIGRLHPDDPVGPT